MTVEPFLVPFWRSRRMHGESIVFVARSDGAAEGRLLFAPDAVLAVMSAAADVTYSERADYLVDRRAGRIVRAPGSRMPELHPESIAPQLGHCCTIASSPSPTRIQAIHRPGALPPLEAASRVSARD